MAPKKKMTKRDEQLYFGGYNVCPHIHFKMDSVERTTLSRYQHMNLLATPRGYRIEEMKSTKKDKAKICKKRPKSRCTERKKKKVEKSYIQNFISELWTLFTPDLESKLQGTLISEFGMEPTEALEFLKRQREMNVKRSSTVGHDTNEFYCPNEIFPPTFIKRENAHAPCQKIFLGERHTWIKEFTKTVAGRLNSYIMSMIMGKRNKRTRGFSELIVCLFSDLIGEEFTIETPRTELQKLCVFVADRLGVLLGNISCSCDPQLMEIVRILEEKEREAAEKAAKEEAERAAREAALHAEEEVPGEFFEEEAGIGMEEEGEIAPAEEEIAAPEGEVSLEKPGEEIVEGAVEAPEPEVIEVQEEGEAALEIGAVEEPTEVGVVEEAPGEEATAEAPPEEAAPEEAVPEEAAPEEVAPEEIPSEAAPEELPPAEEGEVIEAEKEEVLEAIIEVPPEEVEPEVPPPPPPGEVPPPPSPPPVEISLPVPVTEVVVEAPEEVEEEEVETEKPVLEERGEIMERVVSWIDATVPEPSERQEQLDTVLKDRLKKEMRPKTEEGRKALDEASGRMATWIDHLVGEVEEEYGIPKKVVPEVSKIAGFRVKRDYRGPYYSIKPLKSEMICEKAKEGRSEMAKAIKGAITKRPAKPTGPMSSKELKKWADWASNVAETAEQWATFITKTCEDLEHTGNKEDTGILKDKWEEWKKDTQNRAVEWQKNKLLLKEAAQVWKKKYSS